MLLGSEKLEARNNSLGQKKVVALRVTGKSFYEWSMQGQDILKMPHWPTLTHVLLENMMFDHELGLMQGSVREYHSRDGCDEFSQSILFDLRTYRDLLNQIREAYPHLKLIWVIPSTNNLDYWNVFVRRHGPAIVEALNLICKEEDIDGMLGDMDTLYHLTLPLIRRIATPSWWIHYPHECQIPSSFLLDLQDSIEVDYWLLNSYGMLKRHRLPTTHGINQWLEIYPEASIESFENAVTKFCDLSLYRVPFERILMGMATTAVQYVRHPWHRQDAMLFEVRPVKDIRHEILFGNYPCHEKFDPKKGYCMVNFEKPRKSISYDNDGVRTLKFDHVFNGCFGGLVMGHSEFDESPNHPASLLRQVNERFKPYQLHAEKIVLGGTAETP